MKQFLFLLSSCLCLLASVAHTYESNTAQFDFYGSTSKLDPQTQQLLQQINANVPHFDEELVRKLQKMPADTSKQDYSNVRKVETVEVPGPRTSIKVRLYYPQQETPDLPIFVFYHGGGWALGSVDYYDSICQEICRLTPCIVASVDYCLAPDHKYPEPLDDCYAATKWIIDNAQKLGGNANRVAIGGESAGGNLAAAVTLMARDKGTLHIASQVLINPVLNHQFDTLSYHLFAEGYYLRRDIMQQFWGFYLRQPSDGLQPYASPLQAESLADLPPALVLIANFDPLRDEGFAYAYRLAEDDVPLQLITYPSFHGFISFPELDTAKQEIQDIALYLQTVLKGN